MMLIEYIEPQIEVKNLSAIVPNFKRMGKNIDELIEMGVAFYHIKEWIREDFEKQFNEDLLKAIWEV